MYVFVTTRRSSARVQIYSYRALVVSSLLLSPDSLLFYSIFVFLSICHDDYVLAVCEFFFPMVHDFE